jgi:hypothetical protein
MALLYSLLPAAALTSVLISSALATVRIEEAVLLGFLLTSRQFSMGLSRFASSAACRSSVGKHAIGCGFGCDHCVKAAQNT